MIYSVVALESLEPLMVLSWDAAENAEQISVTKGMKRKGTFQIQYDSESMRTTQWLSISMLTSSNWMGNWIDSCCLINVSLVVLLWQNRSSKPRTLVKSNQIIISKSYGSWSRPGIMEKHCTSSEKRYYTQCTVKLRSNQLLTHVKSAITHDSSSTPRGGVRVSFFKTGLTKQLLLLKPNQLTRFFVCQSIL